ncbi:Mitomycin resistance protein mcrB [Ahniella affigens]|uniref:Mitomycin resistance protein mcrB n=1 Tax=Ahniella affigens TaxID=2021234 RepID=A0A2P1PX97_9GAMM|nr:helix-hairpin-helix domain-containing protein [Ahniella affigens]AVP99473.1 Mitomycin resistance protein mcrB [Ahniella affigens]
MRNVLLPETPPPTRLADLRNIGAAMLKDFAVLGIQSVAELARADADTLYWQLQERTQIRHDPCVWDTFRAAIHQAQTGEALNWWRFTPERKARQQAGQFPRWPDQG